jgi:hypothetical protein
MCGVESVRWSQRLRQCNNRREWCAPAPTRHTPTRLTRHNTTRADGGTGFNVSCPGGLNKCSQCQVGAGCIDCNGLPFGTASNTVRANVVCVCVSCVLRVVSCRVVVSLTRHNSAACGGADVRQVEHAEVERRAGELR